MLVARLRRARARRGYSYWGGWGTCCCNSATSFCVYDCHATPIVGAVVTVSGYPSCTTGAGGCCQIDGLSAGTYQVTAVDGNTTLYDQSLTITPGDTYSLSPNCCITVCLTCCDGSAYPYGATVTIQNASTSATVGTGTTDSAGCVTIGIASSGLDPDPTQAILAITPNCSLYASSSGTYSNVCAQAISIPVFAADSTAICCTGQGSCIPIPTNLTITDVNGSWPFVYAAGVWYACYLTNANPTQQASWNTTLGQCVTSSTTGDYPTRIEYYGQPAACYTAACGTPPADTFAVVRMWYSTGNSPNTYHGAAASPGACDGCSVAASQSNCSFGTSAMPTGCSPFAVSIGSLAANTGNVMPDPVGGGVSVS